jgi:MazG family protein
MKRTEPIDELLRVMARLRAPGGCPWDREQNHRTLRRHAIEEVYELIDAIESGDDHEMAEELGDLLLQVVFHCQMARERGAFDFERVCRLIVEKLVRRHPHVFGTTKVKDVDEVWANWERIKHAEKKGTRHERPSALDGIPRHLPALLRAEKLVKKARKAGLLQDLGRTRSTASAAQSTKNHGRGGTRPTRIKASKSAIAKQLFALAREAQQGGWSAEELLGNETAKQERLWRKLERDHKLID